MLAVYLAMMDNEDDRHSLTKIYEEYKNIMLMCALRITKNHETAEDAVHNAFISIIKHKEKLFRLSKKELRTQVVIITKNKCIDLLRKNNTFIDESIEDMEYSLETDDMPVEDQIILIDEYKAIRRHIASLDEVSRLVLEMKYILGMSYKEIGEELGMTAKHVDTRIMRSKAKVRKLVAMGGESGDK